MNPIKITGRNIMFSEPMGKVDDFNVCVSGHNKPQTKNVLKRMGSALEDSWRKQMLLC